MIFIHIPKTGGTSIRKTLDQPSDFYHRRLRDFEERPERTFTVIRNPFDRAVSMCSHKHGEKALTSGVFQKWCRNIGGTRLYKKYPDICFESPMSDYLTLNGKLAVDLILTFENLEQDFKDFFGEDLCHVNKGRRERGYRQYYDESSRNIIAQMYHADLELFGYEF